MISIIVPNYNKSEFISETIVSVICQKYKDWELLIIDDNSTDNSWLIIQSFAGNNNKIKCYLSNSGNAGGSVCRNIGLKHSIGDYILFLDSDDVLLNNCLESRFALFQRFSKLDFLVFPMGTFYEKYGDSNSVWNNFKGNHLKNFLAHNLPWAITMVLWKRNTLNELNGFNTDFLRLQDVELHTRALIHGCCYQVFTIKPDCLYRINENRIKSNYFDFLDKKVVGVNRYLYFFNLLLIKKEKNTFLRYLKGTLFMMISEIYASYFLKKINLNEKQQLIFNLYNKRNCVLKLTFLDKLILKFYMFLSDFNIRFKGLNYITKKLLAI